MHHQGTPPRIRHILIRRGGIICLALLAGVIFPLAGCERSSQPVRKHTFLIVGASQDDPLWPVLQGGAKAYAETVSALKLKMLAPAARDPRVQADLVRRNLDPSVFGLCLQATAGKETRQLVNDLAGRGISVVLIGEDMPETQRQGYVGMDDMEAGKLLAQALRSSMHDRTTFMVLEAGRGRSALGLRLLGFGLGMSEIPHLRELHRTDCRNDVAVARKILAEQGRKYPDLGMWVSISDWPARIDPEELRKDLGEGTGIVLIGALPPVWPLMRQGIVRAAIGTDYGWWGYEAVNLAELAFQRSPTPDKVRLTEPCIVRPQDLTEYEQTWKGWTEGHVLPTMPSSQPTESAGLR